MPEDLQFSIERIQWDMTLVDDVGLRALDRIHRAHQIDEPWTTRGDRQFGWIGHRLQQVLSASRPFEDDGLTLSRLTAQCVCVVDVSAEDEVVLQSLNEINQHALGSAYSYSRASRQVVAAAVAYVHEQTFEWRADQLGAFSINQLCLAESEADYLADKLGGRVAVREHRSSGFRAHPDDMLSVTDAVFAKEGFYKSRFANEFEMQTIAEISSGSSTFASLGGSASGVALEMSYGQQTSLARLATGEFHRRIGTGLSYSLNLPDQFSVGDAVRVADALNREEANGAALTSHYGAWCWNERPVVGYTLGYQGFMPNSLYRPGVAQDIAFSLIKRAKWVDRVMHAKPTKESVWKMLGRRFGLGDQESDNS